MTLWQRVMEQRVSARSHGFCPFGQVKCRGPFFCLVSKYVSLKKPSAGGGLRYAWRFPSSCQLRNASHPSGFRRAGCMADASIHWRRMPVPGLGVDNGEMLFLAASSLTLKGCPWPRDRSLGSLSCVNDWTRFLWGKRIQLRGLRRAHECSEGVARSRMALGPAVDPPRD